jgi:two-component system response regulator QseB
MGIMPTRMVVALVEDDEATRRALRRALMMCGALVIDYASAEEALSKLEPEAIDLLVTDLDLPGQDGLALIARVRALGWRCRAVIVSGELPEHLAVRLGDLDLADLDVLGKPFELASIRAIMEGCGAVAA